MALKRSAAVVAALLLVGRATGFAREWVLSARGGASGSTDLAIVLLTLPDLLVNLLLAGGLIGVGALRRRKASDRIAA